MTILPYNIINIILNYLCDIYMYEKYNKFIHIYNLIKQNLYCVKGLNRFYFVPIYDNNQSYGFCKENNIIINYKVHFFESTFCLKCGNYRFARNALFHLNNKIKCIC